MNYFLKIILSRNSILTFSVLFGLTIGDFADNIKNYTIYILAVVMAFSTSGLEIKSVLPLRKTFRIMSSAVMLNYLGGSSFLILLSYIFIKDPDLFKGMIVIGASPPGIAVIPFTLILGGDVNFSIIGTLGSYLAAVLLAPLIIYIFTSGTLGPVPVFIMMLKIILIPLLMSRILRIGNIYPIVEKIRGKVIDIGFAFIIFIAVGLNRGAFFSDPEILLSISVILVLSTFGLGVIYFLIARRFLTDKGKDIPRMLFLTVKSSGFTAATSLALFGEKAAIPSAVLSVVVLVYLLFLSIRNDAKSQ